jgi:hypothetical protein
VVAVVVFQQNGIRIFTLLLFTHQVYDFAQVEPSRIGQDIFAHSAAQLDQRFGLGFGFLVPVEEIVLLVWVAVVLHEGLEPSLKKTELL